MQKKKSAKPAAKTKKTNATRQPKVTLNPVQMLEKDFHETPAKLVSHSSKELATLKQQEKKLKSELKKVQSQKKIGKNKRAALIVKAKKNASATNQKLLTAAKQAYDLACKSALELTAKYNDLKSDIKTAAQNNSKFVALNKHLTQFQKMWALKTKKATATKTKKKAPKKSKVSVKNDSESKSIANSNTIENANVTFEREEAVEA
jgi:hypothetical protein